MCKLTSTDFFGVQRRPKAQRIRPLPRGFTKLAGSVAANARRLRGARGWTQAETASKSGLDDRAYREVESGRANLTLATLMRVARAFDGDVMSLLAPASPMPRRRPGRPLTPLPDVVASAGPVIANPQHEGTPRREEVGPTLGGGVEGTIVAEHVADLSAESLQARRAELLGALERLDATLRARGLTPPPPAGTGSNMPPVVAPPSRAWSGLRDFVLALLGVNARGLLAFEIAEAARRAKLRLRENEVHTVLHGLLRRRAISREGRAGNYVYSLRRNETP